MQAMKRETPEAIDNMTNQSEYWLPQLEGSIKKHAFRYMQRKKKNNTLKVETFMLLVEPFLCLFRSQHQMQFYDFL
jgi:hypothetical protein